MVATAIEFNPSPELKEVIEDMIEDDFLGLFAAALFNEYTLLLKEVDLDFDAVSESEWPFIWLDLLLGVGDFLSHNMDMILDFYGIDAYAFAYWFFYEYKEEVLQYLAAFKLKKNYINVHSQPS